MIDPIVAVLIGVYVMLWTLTFGLALLPAPPRRGRFMPGELIYGPCRHGGQHVVLIFQGLSTTPRRVCARCARNED